MYIFIYLFVTCLNIASSRDIQSELIDSYLGASKSAKLINLIQKLKSPDEGDLLRRFRTEVKKDSLETNYESMKLLQKNYDTSKLFDMNKRRLNLQYISNPEVLDIYRQGPLRRDTDVFIFQKSDEVIPEWPYSYKHETRHSNHPKLHYLSNPGVLEDFRRLIMKTESPELLQSREVLEENTTEAEKVRKTKKVMKEKDAGSSDLNSDFKLEETLDLVKPYFVQVFNKLKNKGYPEENENLKMSDNEKPNKVTASSDSELLKKEDIEDHIFKKLYNINNNAVKGVIDIGGAVEPDLISYSQDNKHVKEKLAEPTPTKDFGKEKLKEKDDENNTDYSYDKKNLPASKKSFVEPVIGRDDDNEYVNKDTDYGTIGKDKGYGWERSQYRNSHSSKHKTNFERKSKKVDSNEVKGNDHGYSDKKRFEKKSSRHNKDKDKISEENYSDRDSKKKKQNDNRDKKDNKWNKKHEGGIKKDDQWDKKNEDWDEKDDTWDNKNKDWKKKHDNWNNKEDVKWNKKNEDWDEKDDMWDKKNKDRKKKDDNWNNKKDNNSDDQKSDGEDKWNTKKDDWDKNNDNWHSKKDKNRNKNDDRDSGYGKKTKLDNWDSRHEEYPKKDKWNKNDGWKSKEVEIKNKKTYNPDDDWDKKQNYDISSVKDKKRNKDNEKWGGYDNFKTIKSKPVSYEEMDLKKTHIKKDTSVFKPKIVNNWDKLPKHKNNDQHSGPSIFGRTPIPFRGSKSVYE